MGDSVGLEHRCELVGQVDPGSPVPGPRDGRHPRPARDRRPALGETLVFGAVVAAAHPGHGQRLEATVLRALAGDDDDVVVYQVEPHTLDDTEPSMVPAESAALVTWWPSAGDIMAARRTARLGVVAGEILPGGDTRGWLVPVPGAADLSAAQQEAALLVGLDPVPHAAMVTVDIHGDVVDWATRC